MLQHGPGGHHGGSVLFRQGRCRSGQPTQVAQHQVQHLAQHQHEGAVEHVLARRAEMSPLSSLGRELTAELGNEGDDRAGAQAGGLTQGSQVDLDRVAELGNSGGRLGRYNSRGRFSHRQRRFELQHVGQPRVVGCGLG